MRPRRSGFTGGPTAKFNVYLPDDLEREVRDAGLSISPICKQALRQSLDRLEDEVQRLAGELASDHRSGTGRTENGRMEIRAIREDEANALAELTVRVYEEIGATEGGEYVAHLRDVRGRMETCTVLVAIEDDKVVGGVTYVPGQGPWCDRAAGDESEFRMLVVDPDYSRRGIGEALVRACIGLALEAERSALVLLSNVQMTTAHRLYERLGFVRWPDRDWYISEDVDLRCYVLPLR